MVKKQYIVKWTLVCLLLSSVCSCVKDRPHPVSVGGELPSAGSILLLNEGAYGLNNAELSYLQLADSTIHNNLFQQVNGKKLGDVAQDLQLIGAYYYVTLNNSGCVSILDTATLQEVKRVTGLGYPRYIRQVNATQALISCLYAKKCWVFDLASQSLTGELPTEYSNTEHILPTPQGVYISTWDTASPYLFKFNPLTFQQEKKILLPGRAAHDLVQDKEGRVWVLSGNKYKQKKSYLSCVDPQGDTVLTSFAFDESCDPIRLQINGSGDTLYFIQVDYFGNSAVNGLFRMDIHRSALPAQPFLPAPANSYFWSYGIHPQNGHYFVSDPKGFAQQGSVLEYDREGHLLRTYQSGIGVNTFLFR